MRIMIPLCGLCAALLVLSASAAPTRFALTGTFAPPHPVKANCSERFFRQTADHFGAEKATFEQRYFLCDAGSAAWLPGDPIFLYLGNEANVELYLNATGIMWEWAPEFRAKLVFVEHRYWGKSYPAPVAGQSNPYPYLSVDQALADYTKFSAALKNSILQAPTSPIVGFGGSYGGQLCAWLRISTPWAVDMCLAASAPIMAVQGLNPPVNTNFYAQIVTEDASSAGGSTDVCSSRIRKAWPNILKRSQAELQRIFRLCEPPKDTYDLNNWLEAGINFMAMGSYPYPSSYILSGRGEMPAYPLRKGCSYIAAASEDEEQQLEALRDAVAIFYNFSDAAGSCFNTSAFGNKETTENNAKWQRMYCKGVFQVGGQDGVTDMFWDSPYNATASQEGCFASYGLWPDPLHIAERFGGWHIAKTTTRILFSNGALDPWRGAGITKDLAPDLPAIVIPEVGHHIDLFWSRPDDPPEVTDARATEKRWIKKWVDDSSRELRAHHGGFGAREVLV